jgi:hypothetical protein
MLRCPETLKISDTGITTSGRESLNGSLYEEGTLKCPFCKKVHHLREEAFLKLESESRRDHLWRPNQ